MRVWAVSDVHTDYKENMAWCGACSSCISRVPHINTCINFPSYWRLKSDWSSFIVIRQVLILQV